MGITTKKGMISRDEIGIRDSDSKWDSLPHKCSSQEHAAKVAMRCSWLFFWYSLIHSFKTLVLSWLWAAQSGTVGRHRDSVRGSSESGQGYRVCPHCTLQDGAKVGLQL